MRNSKYFLITMVSLVIIAIAIVLLLIWGYRIYFTGNQIAAKDVPAQVKPDEPAATGSDIIPVLKNNRAIGYEDSLEDSLQQKLVELKKLQDEIQALIDSRKAPADSTANDEKISKLEQDIKALEKKNKEIADQNKKLSKVVNQLARKGNAAPIPKPQATVTAGSTRPVLPVTVSGLNVYALNEDQSVTTNAGSAASLRGSFFIKTNDVQAGDLMVVVIMPGGKVLLNEPWQSGYFDTPDGKKMYSTKLHFNSKEQRVNFDLSANNLHAGTYTVELYYQGELIASLKKTLS